MNACVALLGGSFDPVHNGHIALGAQFAAVLRPDQLRVVPAGCPWQKDSLHASCQQRAEMVQLAFAAAGVRITLDRQEIERGTPTYTIDTLRNVRAELGPQAAIVLLIGADQLRQLDSWHEWRALFDYAHIGVAARPGFALTDLPAPVAAELTRRQGSLDAIRSTPHGLAYLQHDLALDVSATAIRAALQRGEKPASLVPQVVLDYIEQHHLYRN